MEIIKVILLAVALVSIALFGLATRILFKKGGKFPNTHVGGNRHLKRQGVHCYQTQDRLEQREVAREIDYSRVKPVVRPDALKGPFAQPVAGDKSGKS